MLPQIKVPEFYDKIPSTGKEIKYRPYLVNEQKILYMALEGKDPKEITNAVINLIDECILTEGVEARKLASFDIEYLFLKLRCKSVGEVIDLKIKHTDKVEECEHVLDYKLNLELIDIDMNSMPDSTILLDEETGIGVKMKYPTIEETLENQTEDSNINKVFSLISTSIESVFDADKVYEDFTDDEINNWISLLSKDQFEMILNFFDNIPVLKHTIEWECPECGEKDSLELKGLQSFFS